MERLICVVGNKLTQFCINNDHVKTVDNFKRYLCSAALKQQDAGKLTAIIGQGVSDVQIDRVDRLIEKNKLASRISIRIPAERKNKAASIFTHKRKSKNSMISSPTAINENVFESYLTLNDQCAEMSDHVTGQHLQGMILVEAARQMTLAVTELFFLTAQNRKDVSFITHNLKSDFNEYVFPLDIKFRYEIIHHRKVGSANAKFNVRIACIQDEKIKMNIEYVFSLLSGIFNQHHPQPLI